MTPPKRPEHAVTVELPPIAFYHCDPLGVVWHGRYFEFFETARMALLSSVDLDVPQIRELGYRMFVTDARCRYMAPLSLGDCPLVTAWFSANTPLIRVAYDIYNPVERSATPWSCRAVTVLATTDDAGTLLPATPDAILERLPSR